MPPLPDADNKVANCGALLRPIVLGAGVVFLLTIGASAAGSALPPVGHVEGVVLAESTKRPVAGATVTLPDFGVSVPLKGVADNAKNQCSVAPCTLAEAHTTVAFTIRTGKAGTYRWQCFVPCAAGFVLGFGGPMQSVGYMDGYLHVIA